MFDFNDFWKDENVYKLCNNQEMIQELLEKCNPKLEDFERYELFYQYFHDYFHDHKVRIDPKWLDKQMDRPDAEERMIAFYESIYNAIITDGEDWETKGRDVMVALLQNNATALMIALCGWGPINLAKRALLMRGVCDTNEKGEPGRLVVVWDDDEKTSTRCLICPENHQILDFDGAVFFRNDAPTATIRSVFVRYKPFEGGNEYDFQCVSEGERDAAADDDVFWYAPQSSMNAND